MSQSKVTRRTFIAGSATVVGASGVKYGFAQRADAKSWSNWSGSVKFTPRTIESPAKEQGIVDAIRMAAQNNENVRVAATGHSFVPICESKGTLLTLDGLQGMISADPAAKTATFWSGTKIHQMGDPLHQVGLAMENLGDIDRQGIAGAVSTGTHGTGKGIGSISTQVVGMRLVTASGEILSCSATENPEILKAARVSLGSLGIITQITLKCLPAYNLHEKQWEASFDQCMADLDQQIADNRHFEFFWRPQRDVCSMKSLNPTQEAPNELPDREGEKINRSYRIFPSVRDNRFNEIEFAVPEQNGVACLKELRELMLKKHTDITWPLEYRTLAADDTLIGPPSGRETIAISAHQANTKSQVAFFADVESIFRNHQGRPHWGKMHTHTAEDLAKLYPRWEEFHKIRRDLDPQGRFMNDHLRQIFPA
jgi:FAD/FMN-containing dehydrogenase